MKVHIFFTSWIKMIYFISHMVQMKAGGVKGGDTEAWCFISHMVQMKDRCIIWINLLASPLYPTWFRWKACGSEAFALISRLYIPHGSDERPSFFTAWRISSIFISHMVQMKGFAQYFVQMLWRCFISHMVQMKDASCFPLLSSEPFFISHMVQMKVSTSDIFFEAFFALYPTWFRWKGRGTRQADLW